MKNFSTQKERVLQFIDYKGISKNKFYIETGISNGVLDKKSGLSMETVEKFYSTYPEINPEWLLTGKGEMLKSETSHPIPVKNYDKDGIPVLPFDAFAGIGEEATGVNFDTIEERYVIPLFDGMKVDFMISVRGSSMYPKYNSGDVVACRLIQELLFVQWNKVYVLDTVSQGVIIKRLKKSEKEGSVICKSDNESYDPFEIPMSDIRNMALVVGVIRQE